MGIREDVFRVVDANFNRSREGLRVCEDITRFIVASPALTKELKALRHGISDILNTSPEMSKMLIKSA